MCAQLSNSHRTRVSTLHHQIAPRQISDVEMYASRLLGSVVLFAASCLAPVPGGMAGEDAAPVRHSEWTITEQGPFTTAENGTLRLRFAYSARGAEGWFKGGGGEDIALLEVVGPQSADPRPLTIRVSR